MGPSCFHGRYAAVITPLRTPHLNLTYQLISLSKLGALTFAYYLRFIIQRLTDVINCGRQCRNGDFHRIVKTVVTPESGQSLLENVVLLGLKSINSSETLHWKTMFN